ncbi:MAG: hypothetical protein D6820_08810, partial [Lentisphaerae bacterium]
IQYLLNQIIPKIDPEHFLLVEFIFTIEYRGRRRFTEKQKKVLHELIATLQKQVRETIPAFSLKPLKLILNIDGEE